MFQVRVLQGSDLKNCEKVSRCRVPLLLYDGWAGLPGTAPGGGYGPTDYKFKYLRIYETNFLKRSYFE
jgi:hypothetical protein